MNEMEMDEMDERDARYARAFEATRLALGLASSGIYSVECWSVLHWQMHCGLSRRSAHLVGAALRRADPAARYRVSR